MLSLLDYRNQGTTADERSERHSKDRNALAAGSNPNDLLRVHAL
jgi:hypothetical protein